MASRSGEIGSVGLFTPSLSSPIVSMPIKHPQGNNAGAALLSVLGLAYWMAAKSASVHAIPRSRRSGATGGHLQSTVALNIAIIVYVANMWAFIRFSISWFSSPV